jgi:hypothetical protein
MKISGPGLVLRIEDAAVFVCSLLAYAQMDLAWLMFAVLFLLPDVFMLGYVVNQRVGAVIYNVGHFYLSPLLLAAAGWFVAKPALYPLAIIWAAHISFDRMIGYGLKYAEGFKSTHLGRI